MFKHDLNYTTPWFIDGLFEQREKLIDFLKANNIGTRVMYPSISHQEAYKLGGDFPVSKKVADKVKLMVPLLTAIQCLAPTN